MIRYIGNPIDIDIRKHQRPNHDETTKVDLDKFVIKISSALVARSMGYKLNDIVTGEHPVALVVSKSKVGSARAFLLKAIQRFYSKLKTHKSALHRVTLVLSLAISLSVNSQPWDIR